MKVDEAVAYYVTLTALANVLDLQPSAVSNWRARHAGVVPELYARRLHELTRGRLKFETDAYRRKRNGR